MTRAACANGVGSGGSNDRVLGIGELMDEQHRREWMAAELAIVLAWLEREMGKLDALPKLGRYGRERRDTLAVYAMWTRDEAQALHADATKVTP